MRCDVSDFLSDFRGGRGGEKDGIGRYNSLTKENFFSVMVGWI